MITVKCDVRGARDYLKKLEQRDIPRVVGRTIDRTRSAVHTLVSRSLRERVNLSKKEVDENIKSRRVGDVSSLTSLKSNRVGFEIRVSGKPLPLKSFQAKQTKRGVTFKVARRGKRKYYTRKEQNAFLIARFGNHVFVRTGADPPGPEKVNIAKVYGPSLPQFFATKRQRDEAIARAHDVWEREFKTNARFALKRRGIII